jgi:hypothetical protein
MQRLRRGLRIAGRVRRTRSERSRRAGLRLSAGRTDAAGRLGSERQGPLDESEDRSRRGESPPALRAGSRLGASLDARDATPTRQSPFGSLAELWKSSRAAASLRWQAWSLRFSSCSWGPSFQAWSPRGEQAARFGSSRSCLPFLSLWQLDCSCRYGGGSQAARAHDSARSHTPRDVFTAQQEN